MKKQTTQTLSFFKKNATAIIVTIGVGAVGFLVYKIVSSFGRTVENLTKDNPSIDATGKNLDTKKATITRAVARNLASELLGAMDGYGTDEQTIFKVFTIIGDNPNNYLLVHQEFADKPYNGTGSPMNGLWRVTDLGMSEPRNLVYWLKSELNEQEQKKIAQVIQKAGFSF